jgi:general L-amino acid transport system permease protein
VSVRGVVPEDLERGRVLAPEGPVVEAAPAPEALTPGEWVRRNLFSSWGNGLLTVLVAALAVYLTFRVLRFVFVTGNWRVFEVNLRSYMVGRFPADELWRVWAALYFVVALAGLSRGLFPPVRWAPARAVATAALAGLGILALVKVLESSLAWVLTFPLVIVVLQAFGGVKPELWGGFLLNVIVAVVAIFVSFPLGILLALGRRSPLRAISVFSVGFIELVRGVPLVTLLIFGQYVLPLLLPPGMELPNIIRAMFMFTIFSAAYVAEIVRGGLQGIPSGQFEAARALGLSPPRMMTLVILPQALRSTIPSMISHFISLFKDTSLLAALGLFSELLRTARRASADIQFIGDQAEALLPAAFIFWMVAFSMSRWSQRVERRVGVGER